jgi:hypothetical protein
MATAALADALSFAEYKRALYVIAAAAGCDWRTVERFLDGAVAQRNARARSRIIDAMRATGFAEYVPPTKKHPRGLTSAAPKEVAR